MKTLVKFSLLAACLTTALSVHAQVLSDFSSDAGWGPSTSVVGASAFSNAAGVGTYAAGGAEGPEFAYRTYTGYTGSYTSNWSVQLDVNFAAPSSIFSGGGNEQFLNVGLLVTKTGDSIGIEDAPTFNGFSLESSVYRLGSGTNYVRDIRTAVFVAGDDSLDSDRYAEQAITAATLTTVRISFDASSKTLSGSYALNGSATFVEMPSLTADAGLWSMSGSDTFSIHLLGASGYDDDIGMGASIAAGLVTVDNLSAIPEPSTYAAIAGALALGLAAWRRRQRATTV